MTGLLSTQNMRQWIKHSPNPMAKVLFRSLISIRNFDFPAPKVVYGPLYFAYQGLNHTLATALRIAFWTPIFKSKLSKVGRNLYLYGGLPFTAGPLDIQIGDKCRISGQTTLTGRSSSKTSPQLILGNNIDLGWMSTVAVGSKVILEDNVRIAGQCFLAGYPGHPMNAKARARGFSETENQVGDIVLKKDVWLGTGVSVMAGVTIGEGTVVGAASVVTKNLPPNVLAAGNPAKVIRHLRENEVNQGEL